MPEYTADLHLHSPYSIAVSQNISLETLHKSAQYKGLNILGTGDITQPTWRKYLQENLKFENGVFRYKDLHFLLQTELEDNESIHQVVFFPDFAAVEALVERIRPYVKNIDGRWAGRPHVHRSPAELVEIVEDVNGLIGPAHAFTPFKSLFRSGKFNSLEDAYGTASKKLGFLELGLSADSYLADRMENLQNITFLSNSDAHSEALDSLGREFNRFSIEKPSFDEIRKACIRRGGRSVKLNVGLDPRLGKYYVMFCSKCRRRVQLTITVEQKTPNSSLSDHIFGFPSSKFDDQFIYYNFSSSSKENAFLTAVSAGKITCPACKKDIANALSLENSKNPTKPTRSYKPKKSRKIPRLRLGVSERIHELATWPEPHPPSHRPQYVHMIPLIELLSLKYGIKTLTSKTLTKHYNNLIDQFGVEFHILMDLPLDLLQNTEYRQLGNLIQAFRENKITILPGGGGKFGQIEAPTELDRK
ncbi:MAG: endonuclease Q family protein [Promethearchaeota archaeon]